MAQTTYDDIPAVVDGMLGLTIPHFLDVCGNGTQVLALRSVLVHDEYPAWEPVREFISGNGMVLVARVAVLHRHMMMHQCWAEWYATPEYRRDVLEETGGDPLLVFGPTVERMCADQSAARTRYYPDGRVEQFDDDGRTVRQS